MRILQVVEAAEAGVARHVLDLTEELLARGHEIHLAYSPRRADRVFHDRVAALEDLHAWTVDLRRGPHPTDVTGVAALRRGLRARGPFDIVHGHSSKGGAIGRLAALTDGVPTVYTPNAIRTMDPAASVLTRCMVGWTERLLARVNGLIIAVSPVEAKHMVRLGIPRQRLRVVPNGIHEVDLPTREEARSELDLPQDAEVVGFVGRLAAQKAPDVLVTAFEQVARAHPEALLAVVGDGPLRMPLQGACEALGLRDRVRWLGKRDGQRAMPAFDVFALPSRYEGLPHVLLEACLAGLPIITTEVASGGLVVEAGVNGVTVPTDDPDALAKAIRRLLTDKDEQADFGRASRCRVGRFCRGRMVTETERIYREAIAPIANGSAATRHQTVPNPTLEGA